LVKCPKCGGEVVNPFKTWSVVSKLSKTAERPNFTVGLYECPNCGAKFRATIGEDRASIKGMIERIRGIEGELMQVLKNLREKIKALESERASLLAEIEELKKEAEAKASALESEIILLRQEVKALKELLSEAE